uniref:Zinc finger protein 692 n=1 Tax=Calidris pygmaea TaxID=425635 RepID=A0A8C3J730_9CHAR
LQNHLKLHQEKGPFRCPDCQKTLVSNSALTIHRRIHTGERPFQCPQCHKTFMANKSLKKHLKSHHAEGPYQCEICGFTCRQKASLNWHMRKHDAASFYRFSCDLCGKRFEKKDNVTAHKSKSHPEAPPGTPQSEGGGPGPPSAPLGSRREKVEKAGTSAAEPSETAGLGDVVADGGHQEKVPRGNLRVLDSSVLNSTSGFPTQPPGSPSMLSSWLPVPDSTSRFSTQPPGAAPPIAAPKTHFFLAF